jgi:putative CocE/NonD family hydrolase
VKLAVSLLAAFLSVSAAAAPKPTPTPAAKSQGLASEMPAKFSPVMDAWDHVRRDVMIPMRDGVKLHAVVLVPKGAQGAPILLTRTPYNATDLTSHTPSGHLGPNLWGYDNATEVILEGGYIRVVEDVRGKYGSEGDYVMNRPLVGSLNPTKVDHATDTWDTIEWLVKNVPESNGKVGILGISYDGFLPLMALVNPHPALKVSVPMNPMVDGWMGDDWFHNGAFRQQNLPYIYEQEATRDNTAKWWVTHYDDYDEYLAAGSAGELGKERGAEQTGFWKKLLEHPAYDAWWKEQAVDKILAAQPLKVPVMLVHSLWDQEDIYGAMAVYKAIEPKDTANDKVFLVMGPWHHGQEIREGSSLGALKFGSDTAASFRKEILAPFLAQYLKDGASKANVAPVTAYETGTNTWRRFDAWPQGKGAPLYLEANGRLGFEETKAGGPEATEWISDPAKPVPYRQRPIRLIPAPDSSWRRWLVDDQREMSGRPDVAVFTTETLKSPVKIAGQPVAHLVASTSGTDSDWVVKLIDVYPDEVPTDVEMGGYQLMVSADVFRGRYREGFDAPKALTPDAPLAYTIHLPHANHVFLPGHRVMVQVQSSWFPLYDRNPQTFVPNIFWAKPADFRKATQRVFHAPGKASYVELPLVK